MIPKICKGFMTTSDEAEEEEVLRGKYISFFQLNIQTEVNDRMDS